jgi:hypothetical protein
MTATVVITVRRLRTACGPERRLASASQTKRGVHDGGGPAAILPGPPCRKTHGDATPIQAAAGGHSEDRSQIPVTTGALTIGRRPRRGQIGTAPVVDTISGTMNTIPLEQPNGPVIELRARAGVRRGPSGHPCPPRNRSLHPPATKPDGTERIGEVHLHEHPGCLDTPTSGTICSGVDVGPDLESARGCASPSLGFVFQELQPVERTGAGNVDFPIAGPAGKRRVRAQALEP